jgi:hypothetical protein
MPAGVKRERRWQLFSSRSRRTNLAMPLAE